MPAVAASRAAAAANSGTGLAGAASGPSCPTARSLLVARAAAGRAADCPTGAAVRRPARHGRGRRRRQAGRRVAWNGAGACMVTVDGPGWGRVAPGPELVPTAAAEPRARLYRVAAGRAPTIHPDHRVPLGYPKQASCHERGARHPNGATRSGSGGARTRSEENSTATYRRRWPHWKNAGCVRTCERGPDAELAGGVAAGTVVAGLIVAGGCRPGRRGRPTAAPGGARRARPGSAAPGCGRRSPSWRTRRPAPTSGPGRRSASGRWARSPR